MAILGAAQSDFDKIFGGSRVFHDPRLLPRFDVKNSELTSADANAQVNVDNSNYHSTIDRHGVAVTCATTADSYNTLVDISSGAGIMTFAYGPKNSGASTITFKFTVDGTVYTVATYASGSTFRGVLGGSLRGSGSTNTGFAQFNVQVETEWQNPVRSGYSGTDGIVVPIPALALTGQGGSYPILGWTDSFKLEVKFSSARSGIGYADAGVLYLVL